MNQDPLAARVAVLLADFQRRYRSQRGWGALCFPAVPVEYLEAFASDLTPVLREMALEAAREVANR